MASCTRVISSFGSLFSKTEGTKEPENIGILYDGREKAKILKKKTLSFKKKREWRWSFAKVVLRYSEI